MPIYESKKAGLRVGLSGINQMVKFRKGVAIVDDAAAAELDQHPEYGNLFERRGARADEDGPSMTALAALDEAGFTVEQATARLKPGEKLTVKRAKEIVGELRAALDGNAR